MSANNITSDDRNNKNTNNSIDSVRRYFDDEISSPLSSSITLPAASSMHHVHHHQINASPTRPVVSTGAASTSSGNDGVSVNYPRQLRPSSSILQVHASPLCAPSSPYASAASQSYCSPSNGYPLLPMTLLPTNQMCSGLNFMSNTFIQSQSPLQLHNIMPYTVASGHRGHFNSHLMLHRESMINEMNKSTISMAPSIADTVAAVDHHRRHVSHHHHHHRQFESMNLSNSLSLSGGGGRCNMYNVNGEVQVNNCSYQYLSNHQCKCNSCHSMNGVSCSTKNNLITSRDINASASVNECANVTQSTCSPIDVVIGTSATDTASVQGQSSNANINESARGAVCFTGVPEGVKSTAVNNKASRGVGEAPSPRSAASARKDLPSKSDASKSNKRRNRHTFSPKQITMLESIFDLSTHYPDTGTLVNLSKKLKLPIERIQVWFQNRRAKYRRGQVTQR